MVSSLTDRRSKIEPRINFIFFDEFYKFGSNVKRNDPLKNEPY